MTTPTHLRTVAGALERSSIEGRPVVADAVEHLRWAADEIQRLTSDRAEPAGPDQLLRRVEKLESLSSYIGQHEGAIGAVGRQIAQTQATLLETIEAATAERKRVEALFERTESLLEAGERLDTWLGRHGTRLDALERSGIGATQVRTIAQDVLTEALDELGNAIRSPR
ncbi:MAG: hypothetical protein AAGA99_26285 [Actinomycetota bacterium]